MHHEMCCGCVFVRVCVRDISVEWYISSQVYMQPNNPIIILLVVASEE